MLAVVDTNVLVSALLRPTGPPGAVVRAMAECKLTPMVCHAAMVEYGEALRRPRFQFLATDVDELLAIAAHQAMWIEVPGYTGETELPDPSDWPFIACALGAQCPLITGNAKDIPARFGLRIMTAREWAEQKG